VPYGLLHSLVLMGALGRKKALIRRHDGKVWRPWGLVCEVDGGRRHLRLLYPACES